MEEDLIKKEHILEAVLFMMGDAVAINTLSLALKTDEETTINVCEHLKDKYDSEHNGIKIIKLGKKYQMVTNDEYFENLTIVAANPKKPILTNSCLETLSIITYKQPITKTEIEKIRGVNSDHTVNRLIEYNLVEEAGHLDTVGHPILFKTTDNFMRLFGIEDLNNLPQLSSERLVEIEEEVQNELKTTIVNENTKTNEEVVDE